MPDILLTLAAGVERIQLRAEYFEWHEVQSLRFHAADTLVGQFLDLEGLLTAQQVVLSVDDLLPFDPRSLLHVTARLHPRPPLPRLPLPSCLQLLVATYVAGKPRLLTAS